MRKVKRMDSFDKKISYLYNSDQTPSDLPEGFDWDDMSPGIYDKMEEPKKRNRRFFLWTFLFGVFFLGVVGWFFFSKKSVDPTGPFANTEMKFIKKPGADKILPINSDENSINKEAVAVEVYQKTNQNKQHNILTPPNAKNTRSMQHREKNTPENIKLGSNEVRLNTKFSTESARPEAITSGTEIPSMNTPRTSNNHIASASSEISNRKNTTVTFLPNIPFEITEQPLIIPYLGKVETGSGIDAVDNDSNKNSIKFAQSITPTIYGGILLSSGNYQNNSLRNRRSSWLPGYHAGFELPVLTYKTWRLNIGYEHKMAVQLFDFQNVKDTITTEVDGVLTSIITNSLNGATTENRDDVATEAIRTRNYLHYNTFHSHALRLTLVRNFKLSSKFSLIAGLGGAYNFLNRAKGRTIDRDNNILDYNTETPIYRKQSFGIEGGISLNYQIGKLNIRGNLWMEKSLGYGVDTQDEIRPIFYKLGLGVSRPF